MCAPLHGCAGPGANACALGLKFVRGLALKGARSQRVSEKQGREKEKSKRSRSKAKKPTSTLYSTNQTLPHERKLQFSKKQPAWPYSERSAKRPCSPSCRRTTPCAAHSGKAWAQVCGTRPPWQNIKTELNPQQSEMLQPCLGKRAPTDHALTTPSRAPSAVQPPISQHMFCPKRGGLSSFCSRRNQCTAFGWCFECDTPSQVSG